MYRAILVDDEPLTREYLRSALPSLDERWEIAGEAGNGAEALELIAASPAELVITDIKMPVMDGLTLVQKLKEQNPAQQVIILSGYDEFGLAQKALRFGVAEYLLKPIKPRELKETLARVSAQIRAESKNSLTLNTLQELADDYREQVARNYLRAIITDSYVELNVCHPLLHDLKIDLMEGAGCILSLHIELESLIREGIKTSGLFLYQHMLFEGIRNICAEESSVYPLADGQGNTAVYFTAPDPESLFQRGKRLFEAAAEFARKRLYVTVTGGLSGPQNEILEMRAAYLEADERADGWMFDPYKTFFPAEMQPGQRETLEGLEVFAEELLHGMERHTPRFYTLLQESAGTLPKEPAPLKRSLFYLFGKVMERDREKELFDYDRLFSRVYSDRITESPAQTLLKLVEQCSRKREAPSGKNLIESAEEYIRQHFTEPITLTQIADYLRVSPNYLSSQFHEGIGESYIKYITRLRMEYAAHLLKSDRTKKISSVAEQAGYCSIKHFNYVFKEYFGVTPGQYQRSEGHTEARADAEK